MKFAKEFKNSESKINMPLFLTLAFLVAAMGFQNTVQAAPADSDGIGILEHDHPLSKIMGTGLELFERNHAFSGQILEQPVFGAFEHEPYGGTMQFRKGNQTLQLKMDLGRETYSGSIAETRRNTDGSEEIVRTSVSVKGVKKVGEKGGEITLLIDDEKIIVKVTGKEFKNNHFISPTFETTWKGEPVSFEFTGESCMGYSVNLAALIITPYVHLKK